MNQRFEEGREGLESMRPGDLWPEIQRRASTPSDDRLADEPSEATRGRWLLVAAVVVLVAGMGAAVLAGRDDRPRGVASGEGRQGRDGQDLPICPVAVGGAPVAPVEGSAEPPIVAAMAVSARQNLSHLEVDGVVLEIHVPAALHEGGENREVQLERGTASLLTFDGVVQLRWSPSGAEPCDTFTVSARGEPGDEAVAEVVESFADRLMLSGDPEPAAQR